ncbi:hypothetical protein BGZ65_008317 [Modicella reniformis]|uniref:Uncharacterized protein n=1 Tax=Modicella reniformis TaxID=1440133 RepID=A0A9P6IJZ3_9FUNG|nr:hypothetical protein BGZ65_008317 [Modicella reniformis]
MRNGGVAGDSSALNSHVLSRGRRSSNSWSSYRTLSNDSLFSITGESSSPIQMRSGGGGPLSSRPTTAYRARALLQQQQQRQQEYFKGFTFEGESILESIKRQDDEQQASLTATAGGDDDEDEDGFLGRTSRSAQALSSAQGQYASNQFFSGEPRSIDSIFGSM